MPVRPNGKMWSIREQIIEDPASGLTLQFEIREDGRPQLLIFGESLPFGNREILFDHQGIETAGGSFAGTSRPAWVGPIET
jgi:hypothetical protein